MTFLAPLALAIVALAVAPLIAHALRQGKARTVWFPATRLVPTTAATAQRRNRLEDRLLLLLRVLLLAALALLGASPFVSCSRLSLSRTDGASMAVALVIDDSGSMRVRGKDIGEKFERAREGAEELLDSARKGDAFSVILAGAPARLLTPPTTDLRAVRQAVEDLGPSDRTTDLESAIRLAKSSQEGLPHGDKKVVVLSDFGTDAPPSSESSEDILAPLEELRRPFENCALSRATRTGSTVSAQLYCTSPAAAAGRSFEVVDDQGTVLASTEAQESVLLDVEAPQAEEATSWTAKLTRPPDKAADQLPEDDETPVLSSHSSLVVAVRADASRAGIQTGDTTALLAALAALESGARIEPVSLLPDSATTLQQYGALIIDDPAGFTPEVRDALEAWVEEGGVALTLLGPRVRNAPLGSDFSPFVKGAVSWTDSPAPGASKEEAGRLGELTTTWSDLEPKGRVNLIAEEHLSPLATFSDGAPLVAERAVGQGLLLVSTLPASVDTSDFALRPAFLALLDYVLHEAALRHQAAATEVGRAWRLAENAEVTGPQGSHFTPSYEGEFTPSLAGRYVIEAASAQRVRYALRDGTESIRQPRSAPTPIQRASAAAGRDRVDISREIAFVILVLGALELIFRAWGRRRSARTEPASAV